MIIKKLNFLFQKNIIAELKNKTIFALMCFVMKIGYPVYLSDEKVGDSMDLLVISDENKSD